MHNAPKVQRIKTNAECSHSIPFVAACGIRKIHLLAALYKFVIFGILATPS